MEVGRIDDIDIIQMCTAIVAPGKLQTRTTNGSDRLKLQYEESVKLHCAFIKPIVVVKLKKKIDIILHMNIFISEKDWLILSLIFIYDFFFFLNVHLKEL